MRIVVAVGLALHGLLHLIGFVVPWQIAQIDGFPYATSTAWRDIALGDQGAKLLGVCWLVAAIGFWVAALGVAQGTPWATLAIAATAALSAVLCVGVAPVANAGFVIDVMLLAAAIVLGASGAQSLERS
jgi:hypothetical protein